jgi:twitching motility protein PilT
MPQLDKLLAHILPRGARALRMEPNQQPVLDMDDGGTYALLANPVPSTMIEMLAREVVPSHLEATLAQRGEATFDHEAGDLLFRISLTHVAGGMRILAEPGGGTPIPERMAPPAPDRNAVTAHGPLPGQGSPLPPAAPVPSPSPSATHPGGTPLPGLAAAVAAATAPGARPQDRGPTDCGSHPLAEQLFRALLDHKASDLHCSSYEAPIVRVSGDLEDMLEFGILGPGQLEELMEAVAPPRTWKHFLECHDADFAYPFEAGNCRLRVNYFMDRTGPGLVARVIPNEIPDPDKLGIPDPVRRLAGLQKGLVLVTGPTGSGKSTTLAAIIDLANRNRTDHILTIEDPIEFVHPRKSCLINQREVGTHTDSFKSGLRAALREDPDIVLVGEMRDLETIAIAIETAVTGHLVFGTLHTSSAIGTIDRIVDQFPADRQQQIRVMLADSLKAVISQVLLKKIGGGRVAALETLFITPAIANLMREGKNFQIASAMQTGRAYGQRLMNDTLVELIQNRKIEILEGYIKCPDKESFMAALKRAGIPWDPRAGEEGFNA